jgi:hypothetical protein
VTEIDPIFIFLPSLKSHSNQFQSIEQIFSALENTTDNGANGMGGGGGRFDTPAGGTGVFDDL